MCGEPIPNAGHSHVASITDRRLMCTCRACYLLFTQEGSGRRRLRAVPDRPRRQRQFAFTQEQWDELAIPVDLVFLLQQSDAADATGPMSLVACYPSPAGATESELDLSAWSALTVDNPVLADVEPDVEAVLIRRDGALSPAQFTGLVVPIDACYELVGIVRQHWTGFHGGTEVWRRIEDFFAGLLERAGG